MYVAHPSCTRIHKVGLETFEVETFEFERPDYNGGGGTLKVDSTHIFCGNERWLFRMNKDGSGLEIVYDNFNNIGNFTLSDDQIYLLDRLTGAVPPNLYAIEKESGSLKAYGQAPETSAATSYSLPLNLDEPRERLYWWGGWWHSLNLTTGDFLPMFVDKFDYAAGADQDYVYWAGRFIGDERTQYTSVILRIHKDRLDELAAYQASLREAQP